MAINKASLDLIKHFEGFRATCYLCPANVPTIGYGTTKGLTRADVGKKTITEAEATKLLMSDVKQFEAAVDRYVRGPMTDNQRGALVSFVYNLGATAFGRSTLLKRINAKAYIALIEQSWMQWNKATVNGKLTALAGLTRRRKAEFNLFVKP